MYRIQKWSTNLVRASRRSKRRRGVGRGCRPAGGAPEQGAGLWGGAPEQDVGGRNVKQGTGGREQIDGASSSLHLPPLSLFPPPPSLLLLTFSLGPATGRHRTSQGTALGASQGPPGGRAFPWRAGPRWGPRHLAAGPAARGALGRRRGLAQGPGHGPPGSQSLPAEQAGLGAPAAARQRPGGPAGRGPHARRTAMEGGRGGQNGGRAGRPSCRVGGGRTLAAGGRLPVARTGGFRRRAGGRNFFR